MKHSFLIPIVFVFISLLCMSVRCQKEIERIYKYAFVEKLDLFPAQKIYHIGDTSWLQYSNAAKKLFDSKTSQEILLDTISVPFQISLNSRYNAPTNPQGGFCDFLSSNGINAGLYLDVYGTGMSQGFGCNSSNSIDFKVGVVLIKTGIYSLDLGFPRDIGACQNRISSIPISTIEYRFNVPDCNKDIYLSIPVNSRGESNKGYTESEIDNKQIFVLKVE